MKRILILVTTALLTLHLSAQKSIQSMVFDEKNSLALELASIRLLNSSDSSILVASAKTNINGAFALTRIKPGNYILKVSMLGFKEHRQLIKMENKDLILKNIQLKSFDNMLGTVEITGTAAQMTVKKDTTEFNATAFKTAQNAVVEDLLKRLPGVEVSSEGKITVNGQEVKKIRVDGKKFFGEDIEMATKNIPADLISKIQVHDQKSEMAQLTGFEDNDTERIINLVTKPNRRSGIFGNVTGGAGLDTENNLRYDGNGFLNIMAGQSQTAITAGANNTNTSRSMRGRGGFGSSGSGITETMNLGVNNNTEVSKKLKLGGDASVNNSENNSITSTERESYLKGETYNNSSKSTSTNNNLAANLRLEAEWKPDTLNTIIFQPSISYNKSSFENSNNYVYRHGTDTTSFGKSASYGNGNSINANMNIIYNRRSIAKRGRNFSVNVQSGLSQNENLSWNYSDKTSNGIKKVVDQYTNSTSDRYNASIRTSLVEPLWNVRNLLEASASFRTTNNKSEKLQYNKDSISGLYTALDTIYSNNFINNFYSETLEMNYRYTAKDYNLMLGMKAEPSQTTYDRSYANGLSRDTTYGVLNFAPTARFQYNFDKRKFARVDYRGSTDQPSLNQMQPVKNNSNLMNETIGNPTLNPEFNHRLSVFYSSSNSEKLSSFSASLTGQMTKDALVTNSIYEVSGKQYSQTVNAIDLPYNLSGNVMFNMPIIPKRLQFNTNTSAGFDKRFGYSRKGVDFVNSELLPLGDLSDTRRYNGSESLSLTFTTDVLELGGRGSLRYSNTYNTLSNITSETYDWTASGNFVVHLPYNLNIASDINFTTLQGYSNFDKNQLIWNASIDKSMFKNKGVLALKWFDILHQQLNIRQSIGDNYIQYTKYNALTSYFMLSFSYKINQFKMKATGERPDFNRFGPPSGDFQRRMEDGGGRRFDRPSMQ